MTWRERAWTEYRKHNGKKANRVEKIMDLEPNLKAEHGQLQLEIEEEEVEICNSFKRKV